MNRRHFLRKSATAAALVVAAPLVPIVAKQFTDSVEALPLPVGWQSDQSVSLVVRYCGTGAGQYLTKEKLESMKFPASTKFKIWSHDAKTFINFEKCPAFDNESPYVVPERKLIILE